MKHLTGSLKTENITDRVRRSISYVFHLKNTLLNLRKASCRPDDTCGVGAIVFFWKGKIVQQTVMKK